MTQRSIAGGEGHAVMTNIQQALIDLVDALPDRSKKLGDRTKREAALWLHEDGTWSAAAGGHYAVSLGEWSGDFDAEGNTAEIAIAACMQEIIKARP